MSRPPLAALICLWLALTRLIAVRLVQQPDDDDCVCKDGSPVIGMPELNEQLRLMSSDGRSSDDILRMRKAAQELCDGDEQVVAFQACAGDPNQNGYCCVDKSSFGPEVLETKAAAPERYLKSVESLSRNVSRGFDALAKVMGEVTAVGERAVPAIGAFKLLAYQRQLAEEQNIDCRRNMDALDRCEDPLNFLLGMIQLYEGLESSMDNIGDAAAFLVPKVRTFAWRAAKKSKDLAATVRATTLAVGQMMWRNRFLMMAGLVAAKGAGPLIEELKDDGLGVTSAENVGHALELLLRGSFKRIACPILRRPYLMAALVRYSIQRLLDGSSVLVEKLQEQLEDADSERLEKGKIMLDTGKIWLDKVASSHNSKEADMAYLFLTKYLADFWRSCASAICQEPEKRTLGLVETWAGEPTEFGGEVQGPAKRWPMKLPGRRRRRVEDMTQAKTSRLFEDSSAEKDWFNGILESAEELNGVATVLVSAFGSFIPPSSRSEVPLPAFVMDVECLEPGEDCEAEGGEDTPSCCAGVCHKSSCDDFMDGKGRAAQKGLVRLTMKDVKAGSKRIEKAIAELTQRVKTGPL